MKPSASSPALAILASLLFGAQGLAQPPAAPYDAAVVIVGQDRRIERLLDFDGDGFTDAIGTWWTLPLPTPLTAILTGWRNDGTGALNEVWSVPLGSPTATLAGPVAPIATGDFDLDGDEDFVVGVGNTLRVYLSSGASTPTLLLTTTEANTVTNVAVADFDADGWPDVALTAAGSLQVYRNQGGLSLLATAPAPLPPPSATTFLTVAEVDGNGAPDLVVTSAAFVTTVRLYSVASGNPVVQQDFTLPLLIPPMPAAGDVDGEGDEDFVVFGMTQYHVLRRVGPAAFNVEGPTAGGPATDLADADGDGDLDGVCCGGGGGPAPFNTGPSTFEVSINDGTGAFAAAFPIEGLGAVHLAGAADLEGDGDLDLVAGRCVYYSSVPLGSSPLGTVGSAVEPLRRALDYDGDGDPDLGFGLGSAVNRNAGDGGFAAAALVAPPPPPGTIFDGPGYPGDFDGDGDVDLLVQHRMGSIPTVTFFGLRFLRNTGGGALLDGGPATTAGAYISALIAAGFFGLTASDALVADADGDGDLDLTLRKHTPNVPPDIWWSLIWFNDGTGFFPSYVLLPQESVRHVGDFDGDAVPDLLSIYNPPPFSATGPLVLRRGQGSASFGPPSTLVSEVAYFDRIEVSDIDGDGDLDIGEARGAAEIHLNDGSGGIASTILLPGGAPSSSTTSAVFVATDANGDGLDDAVVFPAFASGPGSHVLLRMGPGLAFAPPLTQVFTPGEPVDVDGDMDEDFASQHVVRSRRFEPPVAGVRRQYGAGLPGTGGIVPTIGETGPFRPGFSGELRLTGGLGGALAVLIIGFQEMNLPILGGTLLASPQVMLIFPLGGPAGVPGAGSFTFPFVSSPLWSGFTFYHQFGVADPGAAQGIAFSNGLRITIGQ